MPSPDNSTDPFAVFRDSRTTSSKSDEIQKLTKANISRFRRCHCKLPYVDEFKKHYLYYDRYGPMQVWEIVGGNLEEGYGKDSPGGVEDTCATRISYALNKSGKLIPANAPSANMNYADNKRYILSAREMNNYFKKILGKPDYILTNTEDFNNLKAAMNHDHAFIMASDRHIAFVTHDYNDSSAPVYLGNVWFLPTQKCNCG